jgi:hypothetical protein
MLPPPSQLLLPLVNAIEEAGGSHLEFEGGRGSLLFAH